MNPASCFVVGIGRDSPNPGVLSSTELEAVSKIVSASSKTAPQPVTVDDTKRVLATYAVLPQGYKEFSSSPFQNIFVVEKSQAQTGKWDKVYHGCFSLDHIGVTYYRELLKDPEAHGEQERQLNMRLQYSRVAGVLTTEKYGYPKETVALFDKFHCDRALSEKRFSTEKEFQDWKAVALKQKAEDGEPYKPLLKAFTHGRWAMHDGKLVETMKVAFDHMFVNRLNAAFKMSDEQKKGMKVHVTVDLTGISHTCANLDGHKQLFKCACFSLIQPVHALALPPPQAMAVAREVAAATASKSIGIAAVLNGAIGNTTTAPSTTTPVVPTAATTTAPSVTQPVPGDSKQEKGTMPALEAVADHKKSTVPPTSSAPAAAVTVAPKRKRPAVDTKKQKTDGESKGTPTSPSYTPATPPGSPAYMGPDDAPSSSTKTSKAKKPAAGKFKTKARPTAEDVSGHASKKSKIST